MYRRKIVTAYTDYPFLPGDKDHDLIPLRGLEIIGYDKVDTAVFDWDGKRYTIEAGKLYQEAKRSHQKPKKVLKRELKKLPDLTKERRSFLDRL
jgi:hypothetical protein